MSLLAAPLLMDLPLFLNPLSFLRLISRQKVEALVSRMMVVVEVESLGVGAVCAVAGS